MSKKQQQQEQQEQQQQQGAGTPDHKVFVCVGTPDERKADPSLVPNYRMIRSSVQTCHYNIMATNEDGTPKLDDATGKQVIEDFVVDPGKYLIKGKDPKKRNIYRFTSNVATPDIVRTDPKAYDEPLAQERIDAVAQNLAKLCADIREYDKCSHVLKDGKEVKRIVTIGAEADGKTPLDIIALIETGIMDALKLRGQKQCYKRNWPRAIATLSKELNQTLAPKAAKATKDEEVDTDWEPDVTDEGEEPEVA